MAVYFRCMEGKGYKRTRITVAEWRTLNGDPNTELANKAGRDLYRKYYGDS